MWTADGVESGVGVHDRGAVPAEPFVQVFQEIAAIASSHLFRANGHAGTIDVSRLLPNAMPQEVADQVMRNIEATAGRSMVGSSAAVSNKVPLANDLSMHQAAADYRLTRSCHLVSEPRFTAMCVIGSEALAPCQCFSPASMRMTSPGSATTGSCPHV